MVPNLNVPILYHVWASAGQSGSTVGLISFTEPLCLFLQEQISNWKEQCEDLKKKGPELHGMHGRLSRKKAKV